MLSLKFCFRFLLCASISVSIKSTSEINKEKIFTHIQKLQPPEEETCNFDMEAMEMFTTDAIKSYNNNLSYTWDSAHHFATIPFPDGVLILQIGGCDVFNYAAAYQLPTSDSFLNNSYIFEKVKWMTRSFFASGFETRYTQCINQSLFFLDSLASNDKKRTYRLINNDTSIITNQIFRGFGVRKTMQGMEIWANGFFE